MRKFLVVMDDSPEFVNALRFAAIRASKTGGQVEILGIIAPEEFQHWIGVAEQMRFEAKERIKEHFNIFSEIISSFSQPKSPPFIDDSEILKFFATFSNPSFFIFCFS